MADNKIKLVTVIFEGLAKLFSVMRCKITCCRSSCNTNEEIASEKNVRYIV
jgi:hypothetical protein